MGEVYSNPVSGGVIAAGRNYWPAWRRAMSAGTVVEVGSNTLSSLDPMYNAAINPSYPSAPEWYGNGHSNITAAWCGAVLDDSKGTLWLPLQGGHNDYGGNEPYMLDLLDEVPAWSMLRYPSGAVGNTITTHDSQESTGVYADNRPRAIHSYNKHVYVPGIGPVLAVQGNCAYGAIDGGHDTWSMNETTGEWTYRTTASLGGNPSSGGAAVYDPTRHCIWWRKTSTGRLRKLDIATWTWQAEDTGFASDVSDSQRRLIWLGNDLVMQLYSYSGNKVSVWDLTAKTHTVLSLTGSQPAGLVLDGTTGADWDGEKLLLWNQSSNTSIISTLTPTGNLKTDPWSWGYMSFTGAAPAAMTANGTYGRFGYSARLKGCYLQNATSQKLRFFALE